MTNRKFLSLLLALFMVFSTITPLFAENDSVTVLPPRMAEKEEPDNIVIMEGDKDTIPTLEESGEGGKKIEETLEELEIKEDNSPVILENREENNNIVILPPIKNEENEEGITEPSKETVEPEEPKKEKENKREVKVQVLSKRDVKKPASEGEVNLILLNDNPADINEEVYDEKIRWKESDFKIKDDKIISLSDEGLLKVARNKKLEIPEMENITIIEKEAFKGLSLRSVEIPKNIKEIKDEAFKDNHLKSVKILGKGKEISKNAFNEELVEMYKKSEKEEFLYECEEELEIGKEMVGDAVGGVQVVKTVKMRVYVVDSNDAPVPNYNVRVSVNKYVYDSNRYSNIVRESSLERYLLPRTYRTNSSGYIDISYTYDVGEYKPIPSHLSMASLYGSSLSGAYGAISITPEYENDFSYQSAVQGIVWNTGFYTKVTYPNKPGPGGSAYSIIDKGEVTFSASGRKNEGETISGPGYGGRRPGETIPEDPGKPVETEVFYPARKDFSSAPTELTLKINRVITPVLQPDDVSLYTFSGNTITGLSEKGKTYYGTHHNMVLPGKNPQGQAITAIGEGAFQHNRLSSLDFSRCTSLTTIGHNAFCFNFLSALDLSGCTSLTNIGHYAFRDNKLKTAKIPLSLSILSEFAFKDNPGNNYNKQVYLFTPDYTNPNNLRGSSYHLINPAEGIYDVSLYTFSGTTITGLSEKGKTYYATNHNMILPGKNPRGQAVTAIESGAFYNGRKGYGLTSVNFSYCTSLTSIGVRAFYQNQLTSLDLSKCTKLKNIGDYAFNKNKLTNLDLSRCTRLASIGEGAFADNQLTSINLSSCTNLTSIGNGAFIINQLTSLDLSGCTNLTSIGSGAFNKNQLISLNLSGCTNLASIGIYTFAGSKLKTAKIPLSLTTLADNAFKENPGNNDKKQVYLYTPDYTNPNNLKDTDYHLINPVESSDDVTLYTFDGTTITGLSERGKKYYETHHDMKLPGKNPQGQDVTAIGEAAFYNKGKGYGLTSADFSNCTNLTSIGYGAFKNNKLASLNLSGCISLTSIGGDAFAGNQLSALDLSGCKNLKNIGDVAFEENQIASLDLSKCTNITSIGAYAFDGNRLKVLDLSKCTSLTSIGNFAFDSNQLKTVKIPLSLKTLTDDAFKGNPGSNDKKQVYLYTPDYTNPNNLKDTSYHLINPVESSDDVTLYTFNGTTITGLSERGKKYFETHHDMKLPGKNPQGQDVIAIGEAAFYNKGNGYGLTSVDFKNLLYLKKIGKDSFSKNKIANLDLSMCANLENIGEASFSKNQIATLDLSGCKNLLIIDKGAFSNNKLTNLDLSNCKKLIKIMSAAFDYNQLKSLNLSGCVNLTEIGDGAFSDNQISTLDLSGCTSLKSIGYYAFLLNQLKTVKIPLSLASIYEGAFEDNLGNNAKKQVYLYTPDYTNPNNLQDTDSYLINPVESSDDVSLYIFNGTTITGLSERGKKYFETHHDMVLPGKNPQGQAIIAIGENAFYKKDKSYGLTSVDFSNCTSLTDIGNRAFLENQLANLDLSNCTSLTSIGDAAFSSNQITRLDLSGCSNLANIDYLTFSFNNLKSLDLSGCTNLTIIGSQAFAFNQLTSINLSGCTSLTSIDGGVFKNNQLKTAKIPLSLKTLTFDAFKGNPGNNAKNQVYLYTPDYTNPNNLQDSDYHLINPITGSDDVSLYTFNGTTITGLSERGKKYFAEHHDMKLPGKNPQGQAITAIGKKAFYNNGNGYGLTSVDFSNCTNLTSIGDSAFYRNQLTSLDLSKCTNLEIINSWAFTDNQIANLNLSGCTNLTSIGQSAFSSNQLTSLNLSGCTSLVEIVKYAFCYNRITRLDLSGCTNLKSIGGWAFNQNQISNLDLSGCTNLTTLGMLAFWRNQLKTAKIPYSLTNISKDAFIENPGNNTKNQVYLYTPRRNNPMNLKDSDWHLVDPISFTIKKVDAKGKPMEGVEFAFYKVDRPAPPAPPQNGTSRTDDTELEISSENVSPAVGGISMPDIELNLNPDGPRPEFFPDPKTVVGVKPIFMTATTDKNGKAEITLPYSPYFLVENKTIPGYSINNTITPIDATTEGKIITYTDYEVSIEIPETGTLGVLPYILLALILVGGAYVVLRKKKEEK